MKAWGLALMVLVLAAGCGGQSFKPAPKESLDPCQMAKLDSSRAVDGYMALLGRRLRLSTEQATHMRVVVLDDHREQTRIEQRYGHRSDQEGMARMHGAQNSLRMGTDARLSAFLSETQVDVYHRFLDEMQRRCAGGKAHKPSTVRGSGERNRGRAF